MTLGIGNIGRIGIDDVTPLVSAGHYPGKAVVGEAVPVTATVWREGHDAVAATLVAHRVGSRRLITTTMTPSSTPDIFTALLTPDEPGMWTFRIEGWGDPFATWRHAIEAKVAVGQSPAELANDIEWGARLFDQAAANAPHHARTRFAAAASALRGSDQLPARLAPALAADTRALLAQHPLRELVTKSKQHAIWVDRHAALFGSWYEFFPRSTGGRDEAGRPVHGTFATAQQELPRVASMGFDVVYLPPIHPIGAVNRKGPNNTLTPGPDDTGSPWAIGSQDGGHDAVHPQLGTMDDFDAFVARAQELGMEVALDFALQCAPDHPWVEQHPEWFTTLPDGTIAYAENPPKKYQDIYPLNFDNAPESLYQETLRVVLLWVEHGVRIFRVDNPHTKPANFWQWLISTVKQKHPDVLFLAEAFTRPARLYGLAKVGFTQSYTYFTWRVHKNEIIEFGKEISSKADEARPNLFVNTPDILHESLQTGGPAMFAIRAALAATFSPTWGVYAGFELFEHEPVRPGSEEYLNSEKYELRPRDFHGALRRGESLQPWLTALNQFRRAHPALQQLRNLHFHHVDNDALIAYSKFDPHTGDCVLIVLNLDPRQAQQGTVWLDMPTLGHEWQDRLGVRDLVTGDSYDWGQANYVRLEPWKAVAHILALPPIPAGLREKLAMGS